MKPSGLIIYEGPSLINCEPIVAIANCFSRSENRKTGKHTIQTWILPRFTAPTIARNTREDRSVCGDCKHREWSTCYVNLGHGPFGVFHAYHRGTYKPLNTEFMKMFKGKVLRMGSYGDPTAIPYDIWDMLAKASKGVIGYTHQWKTCDQRFNKVCMASVDSEDEAKQANMMNWRTFRTMIEGEALLPGEYHCPAANESGHKTTCDKCLSCGGTSSKTSRNPVIIVHGRSSQRYVAIIEAIRRHKKRSHLVVPGNFRAKRKVKGKV